MNTSFPSVRKLVQTLSVVEGVAYPTLNAIQELLADLERALTEYSILLRRKQPIKDEGKIIGLKVSRLHILTNELQQNVEVSEFHRVTLQAITELVTEIEQAFDIQFLQEKP